MHEVLSALRAAVALLAARDAPWVYHVTPFKRLALVQQQGLKPNSPMTEKWAEHAEHVKGKVFFTTRKGVNFWFKAFIRQLPVVLRLRADRLLDADRDPLGTRDANADAYVSQRPVPPRRLQVWTGHDWFPLSSADLDAMASLARQRAEVAEDGLVVHYDNWTFQPAELKQGFTPAERREKPYLDYRSERREDEDFNPIPAPTTRSFRRSNL